MFGAGEVGFDGCFEGDCGLFEVGGEGLDGFDGGNASGVYLEVDGFPRPTGYQRWTPIPALIEPGSVYFALLFWEAREWYVVVLRFPDKHP